MSYNNYHTRTHYAPSHHQRGPQTRSHTNHNPSAYHNTIPDFNTLSVSGWPGPSAACCAALF